MCFTSVKLDRPMKGAPSPPIWAKVRVFGPSSIAMKWQPMPALAKLPSGSLVEVACGQPAQNAGMRRSRPSGRSTASGAGGAGRFKPAWPRNVAMPAATLSGDSSISGRNQRGAARVGLAADLGAFVGG